MINAFDRILGRLIQVAQELVKEENTPLERQYRVTIRYSVLTSGFRTTGLSNAIGFGKEDLDHSPVYEG